MDGYEDFKRKLKILYVDRESYCKVSLSKLLNNNFNEITIVSNGVEALLKYNESTRDESKPFDLIITAIDLPKLDGISFLEKIRERNEETNFIILSSHNESDIVARAIRLKIINYIIRPQNIAKIYEIINSSCQKIYTSYKI